ncbi:MAG: DUF2207 domain-containing protein, partial [Candidatus Coproplasma sp.]
MKSIKRFSALLVAAICVIVCAVIALFSSPTGKAYASGDGDYRFTITSYAVDYTINTDRTMQVVEYTTILFEGYDSTGHVHLLPVNAGDRVRDLNVCEILGGQEWSVDYTVTDEYSGYIAADIGDYSNKTGETHTYKLTYTYAITQPRSENYIYLNAIGFGWDCVIEHANITLRLPEGFRPVDSCYFVGKTEIPTPVVGTYNNGIISVSVDNLEKENGVTFNLCFDEGVLSVRTETAPFYLIIIIGSVLLLVMIVVKLIFFRQSDITPVTGVEAPDNMDPLEMGKLIDNKVDREDVTALIFYWANNGNLKIDMSDEDDIALIRLTRNLPEDAPEHQKHMFNRLFVDGDMVKINSLSNSFYTTVDSVTAMINKQHSKLYTGRSTGIALLFTILGALFMGLFPLLYAKFTVSTKLTSFISMFAIIPSIAVYIFTLNVKYNSYKENKRKTVLSIVGIVGLCVAFTALYVWLVPSNIMEIFPRILICIFGYAIVILSTNIVCRTDEYTEKLNHILGFKDFIESAEKDRLETMIEENPELYYKVLPYAQVLGVSDIWEDKFSSLTVTPPSWVVGYHGFDAFDFIVFSHVMHSMNRNMTTHMTSRPQSSGGLSGGGGGFGGGGGGGHGGGGGFG